MTIEREPTIPDRSEYSIESIVSLSPVTYDGRVSHTMGPWRNEDGEIYATVDELDYLIADASGDPDLSIEESDAKAELIAAAPELLRLLQAAYNALRLATSSARVQEVADEIEPVLTRHGL